MTNWDERADDLRRERREAEASERQAAAEAEAKEHAKWQTVYDKLADVARWAIGRYETAGIPPTAIYVEWEEEVQISRRHSRMVVPRKTRVEEAYVLRHTMIGKAYELYRHVRSGADYGDRITSVLMVTPGHQMIWHDNDERCVRPARPGIRALDLVAPVYTFGAVVSIWSKSRPTNNLTDYMRSVEDHSVRDELYRFGRPLGPTVQSEELDLDPFLNEIVEFVDRRTRS